VPAPSGRRHEESLAGESRQAIEARLQVPGLRIHSRDETQVPYQSRWTVEGALHWRGLLFHKSLDLDLAGGGLALGTRRTPEGITYPTAGTGYVRLRGRVDNGMITASLENALDAYLESDVRSNDFLTPFPVAGRMFYVGLTFYLMQ
jgi:hypothetical protein